MALPEIWLFTHFSCCSIFARFSLNFSGVRPASLSLLAEGLLIRELRLDLRDLLVDVGLGNDNALEALVMSLSRISLSSN